MNETFMQKMTRLGVALRFLKKACPNKFKKSIDTMNESIDFIDNLRAMPKLS
jgi:hypothetical protein